MLRRHLVALAALAALAASAPAALAAVVHVRVEGRTATVFGAAEPRVQAAHALAALRAASRRDGFSYHVRSSSFGPYVDRIGRDGPAGSSGWNFKVNGLSPPVGADKVKLEDGDVVLWYYAKFGPKGGPPTLLLESAGGDCYRVWAVDDRGKRRPAATAVLRVRERALPAAGGRACPGPHRGLVRATMPGAVRSNALP